MAVVYIGIGSNVGDRQKNIESAINLLKRHDIEVLKTSSVIETQPVGGPLQDKYLNAALEIRTFYSPHDLLKILKSIEKQLGRIKTVMDGPRPIDLDILLYEKTVLNTPELTIPHPRMFERDFVLIPLKELNPQLVDYSSCMS